MTKWYTIQEIYSEMHFTSCDNTRYVTTFEIDGTV